MAGLERDPEYMARQQQQDELRQQRAEEYRQAAGSVLADLAAAGFDVSSVGDLRRQAREYRGAVPILLRWLPRVEQPDVKEDIVRTVSVPFAGVDAAPLLVAEFRRAEPAQAALRWAIGNALEVVADHSVFDDLVEIVRERGNGKAREMIAVALGNMRDPRAVDVLIGLLNDEEIAGHAIMGLGKLKAARARPDLERFLKHRRPWIRKEAKKAIQAIRTA